MVNSKALTLGSCLVSFITRHLRTAATYWSVTGVDSSGDSTFAAAKAVQVRWEEKQIVFTNASGEQSSAAAIIFVREDMTAGDYLFLGASTAADPTSVTGARQIQGFSKTPRLLGGGHERKAFVGAKAL